MDGYKKLKLMMIQTVKNCLPETNVFIKDRGNSTKITKKVPFALKFSDGEKILGMKKHKRWVLLANFYDSSLIRTRLMDEIGNKVFNSAWNAQFKPVKLYLNNEFIGLYDLGEQISLHKNRVNIQNLEDYVTGEKELEDVNNDGKVDINDTGFIIEIDFKNSQKYYFQSEIYSLPMNLKDPDFDSDTK